MRYFSASSVGLRRAALVGAAALAAVSLAPISASASSGSDNTMFKRHFWRGQAYHGAGYPPQVSDIGRERPRSGGLGPFEATVID